MSKQSKRARGIGGRTGQAACVPLTNGDLVGRDVAGGKGASLSQIRALGFDVPSAFAVTVHAFDQFCSHNEITRSASTPAESVARGCLPPDVQAAVETQLGQLQGARFAVRSSAASEDGGQYSMAGQLETFLNVERVDVFEAIKQCWASLFAKRAQSYLARLPETDWRMAVVVQEQVNPSWAGVAFSLEPLTHSCDELVIEWTIGLGDKLVSGEVIPERLLLSRAHPSFDEALPPRLAEHLQVLHGRVLALERLLECPVDVEWCATDSELWILQVRPITTAHGQDHIIWSNVNLTENFPNPLAPLAWSFIERFYEEYMRATLKVFGWSQAEFSQVPQLLRSLTGIHGGRIYYNLTSWYRLISYFPRGADLQSFLNTYIGQDVPISTGIDSTAPALRRRQQNAWGTVRLLLRLLTAFTRTTQRTATLETHLAAARKRWRIALASADDPRAVLAISDEMLSLVSEQWQGPCGADLMVMILPSLLGKLLEDWGAAGAKEALPLLLQGVSVKSDEPSQLLWKLSQMLVSSQPQRARPEPGAHRFAAENMTDEQRAVFQDFVDRFGARCYNDCSLITPTFEEEPALAWDLVEKFAGMPDRFSEEAKRPLVEAREQALTRICNELPGWQAQIVRRLARLSLSAIKNREAGRMQQSLLFGEVRGAYLRLGSLLAQRGALQKPDDVFFCTLPEVDALSRNAYADRASLPGIIEARKAEHLRLRSESPPSVFVLRAGEALSASSAPPVEIGGNASRLRGTTVSRGKVSGVARVLRDPSSGESLERGEILVAASTDPGWTPLFMLAGGLILERGGLLSHGAIVAREMDIPALVGVKDACSRIRDGARLMLDATSGVIELESALPLAP